MKLVCDIKGTIPKRYLSAGAPLASMHFDGQGRFLEHVLDPATGKELVRTKPVPKATRSILKELTAAYSHATPQESKWISDMADLIDKALEIDPTKRIQPDQAVKHPLFNN